MKTLEDFLSYLFEGLSGYVYSPLLVRDTKDMDQQFFLWPEERSVLKTWIEESSERGDVYISPAIYREPDSHKKFVKASKVVWAEYDGTSLPNFGQGIPEPDCIIQSSSATRQHLYWSVDPGSPLESIEAINRGLAKQLHADSGWALNKLLRPPFTRNHKYDNVYTGFLHFQPNGAKTFPVSLESDASSIVAVDVSKLPDYEKLLATKNLSTGTVRMVTLDTPVQGARSEFLMKVGYLLAEEGLTETEIVSLLLHTDSRVKKFEGRDDQLLRLSEIASKAWHQAHDEEGSIQAYSPLEIVNLEMEIVWMIQDWLHDNGGMILSGPPGIGKTQLSLQMMFCLASGQRFLDKPAVEPKRVLFMSLEMDIVELKYLYKKQFDAYVEHKALWDQNTFIVAPEDGINTAGIEYLIDMLNPDVLFIDSLSELAGDDLKEAEARRVMKWFRKIRRTKGIAVVLIHHNRKAVDGRKPKKLDDLYGSFWFAKAPDTVIGMWQEDHSGTIEVNSLKVRFGQRTNIDIVRDHNTLTFTIQGEEKENDNSDAGQSNTTGLRLDFGQKGNFG